jgi:hypothetical protein
LAPISFCLEKVIFGANFLLSGKRNFWRLFPFVFKENFQKLKSILMCFQAVDFNFQVKTQNEYQ